MHVSLGTDVGGGTGFGMLKEGLQAYFMQELMPAGVPLSPAHLLYLCTLAGAEALDLQATTGDFSAGKAFDAVYLSPPPGTPLSAVMAPAEGSERLLSALFALGSAADVRAVWVGGDRVDRGPAAQIPAGNAPR